MIVCNILLDNIINENQNYFEEYQNKCFLFSFLSLSFLQNTLNTLNKKTQHQVHLESLRSPFKPWKLGCSACHVFYLAGS